MSTNVEIETKAIIAEKDYLFLINKYKRKSYVQLNYYIDSSDKPINSNYGIRIRYKDKQYELTLKENFKVGKLETNQIINRDVFDAFVKKNSFPLGEVKNRLTKLNVEVDKLRIIGQLKTTRTDIKYKASLISIDKNEYNLQTDYEVEAESVTLIEANKNIVEFLSINNIKFIENKKSKLERFKNSLKK